MSIIFKQVNHLYDPGTPYETHSLRDVSFEIKRGEFIGLIGHTGSGKSTLIQLLNGLLKPSSGEVFVNGFDMTAKGIKFSEIRKRVGLVFQYPEYQLFEETVAKDVAFGPLNMKLPKDQVTSRVNKALYSVGLDPQVHGVISPFELSGGQKRRVAIAGVLAMHPEVLILDEPTAGLDPGGRKDILELIRAEHKLEGRTTILVSHSMEDVAKYVDRIMVMAKGRLVYFDTPQHVFAHEKALQDMGLDIPHVTKIIHQLNAKGFSIDTSIYDVERLSQAIVDELRGV